MPADIISGFFCVVAREASLDMKLLYNEEGAPFDRCQPWRAKRRLVDPSSREAALLTRRAHSARGEAK